MADKKCINCGLAKLDVYFVKGRNTCLKCKNTYNRKRYSAKNKIQKQRIQDRKKLLIIKNKLFILNYFSVHHCIDCGESDYRILEFDHVRGEKIDGVLVMAHAPVSLIKLKKEIDKCDVRCCNCHRRRTWAENNFYSPEKYDW